MLRLLLEGVRGREVGHRVLSGCPADAGGDVGVDDVWAVKEVYRETWRNHWDHR